MEALKAYIEAVAEGGNLPTDAQWASIVRMASAADSHARPPAPTPSLEGQTQRRRFSVERLKAAMAAAGVSAYRLTRESGLGEGYVADMVRGKVKSPAHEKIAAIAARLGVDVDGLYEECAHPRAAYAAWLKAELEKPGRSQSALARRLSLDQSAINRAVNGLRAVKVDEAARIEQYLAETAQ